MKIRRVVVSALMGATFVFGAGCSSMQLSGKQSVQAAAKSAIGGRGSVQVDVMDGVAVIYGWVDDAISEKAVLRAVSNADGILRVENNLQRQM